MRPLVLEPVAWWQRWAEDMAVPWASPDRLAVERLSYQMAQTVKAFARLLPTARQASAAMTKFAAVWRAAMVDPDYWRVP